MIGSVHFATAAWSPSLRDPSRPQCPHRFAMSVKVALAYSRSEAGQAPDRWSSARLEVAAAAGLHERVVEHRLVVVLVDDDRDLPVGAGVLDAVVVELRPELVDVHVGQRVARPVHLAAVLA